MIRALSLFILLFSASITQAAIDAYEFESRADEARFHELTSELRCPKCQNQNIADSDSPIAKDLRREVYRMVDAGNADSEVIDFMVDRYGDFVLYRPKVTSQTWLLWYGPYLALGLGFVVIATIVVVKRRQRSVDAPSTSFKLSSEERSKVNDLLNKEND